MLAYKIWFTITIVNVKHEDKNREKLHEWEQKTAKQTYQTTTNKHEIILEKFPFYIIEFNTSFE